MSDPFYIEGPALISFSGGRTSGYMLWRIVQAHGGELPPDVVATFANTGKERPETLDFVLACGIAFDVPIRWLERRPERQFAIVDYATAARDGEPFAQLIAERRYVPNGRTRFCTEELKIRTMRRYARSLGWGTDYRQIVGLRADEPRRVAKMRARNETGKDGQYTVTPLAEAGITVADVADFWRQQYFDLQLPNINGKALAGNCDLCFMKGVGTLAKIIKADPGAADWWIAQEAAVGGSTFRNPKRPHPTYRGFRDAVLAQLPLALGDDPGGECFCHD